MRIEDGEPGLSARTIARRLSSIAGLFEYLIVRDEAGVERNPVPRGLAGRRAGQRGLRELLRGDLQEHLPLLLRRELPTLARLAVLHHLDLLAQGPHSLPGLV
ncbi:MAG: hypothetical protein ACLP0J_06910 [Solirubrobacteraceae bacterium]